MRLRVIVAAGLLASTAAGCGASDGASVPSRDRPAPSPPSAGDAAAALVAMAAGGVDRVPWADQVGYSIDGTRVGTFSPSDDVIRALTACPPGAHELDGHSCPVSPLTTVAAVASEAVVEANAPDHVGCDRFEEPMVPAGLTASSIRPPAEGRDCFSDFAVTLYADPAGEVAWLDFALSGP